MTKRTKKRPYRLSARAESQAETRTRIVEAIVRLHGTLGPARTSLSAIAEEAGVQRLTLYRHFPDEPAIYAACSAHWTGQNPLPAASRWETRNDPDSRAAACLAAFYDYYAGTRQMWSLIYRDVGLVAPVQSIVADFEDHLATLADSLAAAFRMKGKPARQLAATLRHALAFSTWASLDAGGLDTAGKVALLGAWLDGIRNSDR